jgi:hypothetical protein
MFESRERLTRLLVAMAAVADADAAIMMRPSAALSGLASSVSPELYGAVAKSAPLDKMA